MEYTTWLHAIRKEPSIELYCPSFNCTTAIPGKYIVQIPAMKLAITRLVVCANFAESVAKTNGQFVSDEKWCLEACPMGARCKFVHVSRPLRDFPQQALHAHYIWRSLEDVTYERLWVGEEADAPTVRIIPCHRCREAIMSHWQHSTRDAPNHIQVATGDVPLSARTAAGVPIMIDVLAALLPTVRIPASRLLLTEGARRHLEDPDASEIRLCGAYFCGNECRRGDKCPMAHVINVNPQSDVPFARRSKRAVMNAIAAIELVSKLPAWVERRGSTFCHDPYFTALDASTELPVQTFHCDPTQHGIPSIDVCVVGAPIVRCHRF